jgi:hypothetical protein
VTDPLITGLVGSPATYLPRLTLRSPARTSDLTGYQLTYLTANGQEVVYPTLFNLQQGWNMLTIMVNGRPRTFFVFGV